MAASVALAPCSGKTRRCPIRPTVGFPGRGPAGLTDSFRAERLSMPTAIGIDLGTSNSFVAVARRGRVEVLANKYDEPISASVVHFDEKNQVLVGNQAKALAIHDPEFTVTAAKRLMGRYFFSEEVKKAKAVCSYKIVEGPN